MFRVFINIYLGKAGYLDIMYYYTYKITLLQGSFKDHYYFGQHTTENLEDGYRGSGRKLRNYYRKYGTIEGYSYLKEILKLCNSQEELNEAEKTLIGNLYDTDPLCLNLKEGGGSRGKASKETRELQSISQTGKTLSEDTKYKISEALKGVEKSEEFKQNLAKLRKHRWKTDPDYGQRIVNSNRGKKRSEEARRHISEAHKGLLRSREAVEKTAKKIRELTWMHDPVTGKEIRTSHISEKQQEGYVVGRVQNTKTSVTLKRRYCTLGGTTKGRIQVNKEGNVKSIKPGELENYLKEGWLRGNGRSGIGKSLEVRKKISDTLKNRNR